MVPCFCQIILMLHFQALEKIEEMELPKGTFLHFSGLPEDGKATREEVKAALGDDADQCAWVDYSIGKTEGYLRLKEEESNKTIMEKHNGKIKVGTQRIITVGLTIL